MLKEANSGPPSLLLCPKHRGQSTWQAPVVELVARAARPRAHRAQAATLAAQCQCAPKGQRSHDKKTPTHGGRSMRVKTGIKAGVQKPSH